METDDDIDEIRKWITKLLPRNNDYPVLNLIYHMLIQSTSTTIEPPLSVQNER